MAAKMAATLDALSGGRLILFYDCGWQEAEVRAYGLDWLPEEERVAQMDEGLELIKALWSANEPLDFQGRFFFYPWRNVPPTSSGGHHQSGSARFATTAGWTQLFGMLTAGTALQPATESTYQARCPTRSV